MIKKIETSLIEKWFVWWGWFEQIFLDKVQNDIDNLESKELNMETKEIKKKY